MLSRVWKITASRLNSRCYSSKVNPTTIRDIRERYKRQEPLAMCTVYDFTTTQWACAAQTDMVLVGDSLSMSTLGMDSTTSLTLEEFRFHVASVCRAIGAPSIHKGIKESEQRKPLVVVDMPMGSFEPSIEYAVKNALTLTKLSSHVTSLKLETSPKDSHTLSVIEALVNRGIPVVGHIGLTPQRAHSLGGFRAQGTTNSEDAKALLDLAIKLQQVGCWSVVLECIPQRLSRYITEQLDIPTIGIGAGSGTSGQVLVVSDLLLMGNPDDHLPRFVNRYSNVYDQAVSGIQAFVKDVKSKDFPKPEHAFKMKDSVWHELLNNLRTDN